MRLDPSKNIPTRASEWQDWASWHKSLKRMYGKKTANEIWVYAWSKRGGVESSANVSRLRDYMSGEGVDIQRSTSGAIFDSASDFVKLGLDITKWTLIAVGVIVGVVVIRVLVSKNPTDGIKQIAQARGLKGLK